MAGPDYRPRDFWNERLAREAEHTGTGVVGRSERFNTLLYAYSGHLLRTVERAMGWRLAGMPMLDVGSGRGFYVRHFLVAGARVEGLDISDVAVEDLRRRFPGVPFHRAGVADPEALPREARYDLITAFNVFIHVVDDGEWRRALANLAGHLNPGGNLVFNDNFPPRSLSYGGFVRNRSWVDWDAALSAVSLQKVRAFPGPFLLTRHRLFDRLGELAGGLLLPWEVALLKSGGERVRFLRSRRLEPLGFVVVAARHAHV